MPQTPLFDSAALSAWLRRPVDDAGAAAAEKVVWGWLRPLLGVDTRPDSPSDELASWALELGGIAYSNPEGLSRYVLEAEESFYSSERRDEILRMVSTDGQVAPGAPAAPRGRFPDAQCYPDPAVAPWRSANWG